MNNIKRLVESIPEGVDGIYINSYVNRKYFTGLRASAGTLLVTREQSYFIIDFRYIEIANKVVKDATVILQDNLKQQLRDLRDKHNIKTLAIESDNMTVSAYLKTKEVFEDIEIVFDNKISEIISSLREIKTTDEIECIKKAQGFAEKAFDDILNYIKPGLTEIEIAARLEYTMRLAGSEGTSFDSIVVTGENSSMPHGKPAECIVKDGHFVTMDFGAKCNGYCSDMTRTVAVGNVTDEMAKVYNTVLEAQKAAINVIKEGVSCAYVDKVARDIIYNAGYEGCFGHGLGHSLGLEVHESPRFSVLAVDELSKANQVMTVEPGIYLSGKFGCRIEDMVVVTKTGTINLTKAKKDLIIL